MNAIVTGSTGFIGSWLTQELLDNGYKVTSVVRNPDNLLPAIRNHPNFSFVKKDLADITAKDFDRSVQYDVFFNLGWAGVAPEKKNLLDEQMTNIPMAVNALEVCNELGCRLFVSSGTVDEYALATNVIDLETRQQPSNIYGATKVAVHYFLEVRARQLDQPFIWTIIPSTFGERRTDNNIITYTIVSLLNGQKPTYGDLDKLWDFLYVSEVARALRLIGEKGHPGKVYGIGSGEYRPLKEYIKIIRDIVDPDLELGIGEAPSYSKQSFSSCVNIYDLIRDTGFRPQVSFDHGIRKTIEWFKQETTR